MLLIVSIMSASLFVAYTNGANDNFKGVATLFGSGTTDYRKALNWATVTTLTGSLTAFFFATKLIKTFSGKGLVPDGLTTSPDFLLAVALGASTTILFATLNGIPISTTHSLTGALVGAGLVAIGSRLGFETLGKSFFIPLLISPLLAILLTAFAYPLFRWGGNMLRIRSDTCVCFGENVIPVTGVPATPGCAIPVGQMRSIGILVDDKEACQANTYWKYAGRAFDIDVQKVLDSLHFLSAGAVSFSRGLNDTPKIVAISMAAGMLGMGWNIGIVAFVMALGGIVSARRVAQTMAYRITSMNRSQGLTANLVTALLVIFASHLGVPVSTTHIACGSLFGIGLVNGEARWKTMGGIFSAWVLTLPIAASLAAVFYLLFHMMEM